MNEWLLYERKRNAFEKKWKPRIQRVLNNQLQQYVSAYRRGESTAEAFGSEALTKLLFDLYADVGGYWGRTTYKDLRTETRGRRTPARVGGMAGGKALATQGVQVKRFGALGFSIDWANRIISRLRMAGLNLAQYISETTRKRVLDILEDAQTENLTLDQTVQRITTEVQEINRNRAEMIARTEVGRASSEGKMQGAKALGVELEKIWISARDNRTRFNPKKDPRKGDHWVLNGQRQPLDEPFDNGVHKLMQPGDPSAPPAETIRCRCTVLFEVKKDVAGKPIAAYTVPVTLPTGGRTISIEDAIRVNVRGANPETAARITRLAQEEAKRLGISQDLEIVVGTERLQGFASAGVVFADKPDSNGRYTFSPKVFLKLKDEESENAFLRHELRHIQQAEKERIYFQNGYFYWDGKRHTSLKQYKAILKGMTQKQSRELYEESIKKYRELPWESDADGYAGT